MHTELTNAPRREKQGNVISFNVNIGARTYPLVFSSDSVELQLTPESLTAIKLLPSMVTQTDLSIDEPLDDKFREGVDTLQYIYARWFKFLHPIRISCDTSTHLKSHINRTALFFSGGLDAMYSLEKNLEKIDDLVLIRGFDIETEDEQAWSASVVSARKTAQAYGKKLVTVETNVKNFLDDYLKWDVAHGAGLASVAHLIKAKYSRIFIASSYAYEQLFPWGSHPLLDPFWSSSGLNIVHHGCESDRVTKAKRVAQSARAIEHVRVCCLNDGMNCGRCEKCIRTMINFEIAGFDGYRQMFPFELTPALVKRIRYFNRSQSLFADENIVALKEAGIRPDIRRALEIVRARSPKRAKLRRAFRRQKRDLLARIGRLFGQSWYAGSSREG